MPSNDTALPKDPLLLAKHVMMELDDALGQLSCAMDVIEHLTEGHIAYKATNPLHHQIDRLCNLMSLAWPVLVKPEARA